MKLLLRQNWSRLIEQVILVALKKRSSQGRRASVSEHRVSCSENEQRFFKPTSGSKFSSPPMTTSKEREFIVDPGASFHVVSNSHLTPAEKKTWFENPRFHQLLWLQMVDWRGTSICLWFGHVCSSSTIERITRGTSLGKLYEEKKVTQTKALGDRKQARAVGDHERRVETQLQEWLQPFIGGLTRGSSISTDASPTDVAIPPPAIPPSAHPRAKPTSNQSRR